MSPTLSQAGRIADGVLEDARARGAKPLGVIVLDAGGHPIVYKREDGASLFRFDIARAKVLADLGMGADTREIAARVASNPSFLTSEAIATGGGLALSAGGVLIGSDMEIIGAVGVSGDTPDMDEACALAGIAAAGLVHGVKS